MEKEARDQENPPSTSIFATPKSASLQYASKELLKGKPSNSREFEDEMRNQKRWNKPSKQAKQQTENCRKQWNELSPQEMEEDKQNRITLAIEGALNVWECWNPTQMTQEVVQHKRKGRREVTRITLNTCDSCKKKGIQNIVKTWSLKLTRK